MGEEGRGENEDDGMKRWGEWRDGENGRGVLGFWYKI